MDFTHAGSQARVVGFEHGIFFTQGARLLGQLPELFQ